MGGDGKRVKMTDDKKREGYHVISVYVPANSEKRTTNGERRTANGAQVHLEFPGSISTDKRILLFFPQQRPCFFLQYHGARRTSHITSHSSLSKHIPW